MNVKNEKLVLLLLAAINFTHIMDFMIMMPLGTYLMELFKINPQQFSLIVTSYTFSAGIASFIASSFVDRFDRKRVLLFGYFGFIIGTFACAFAPSYELLVAARILAGAFGGLIGAQVLSIVGDIIPFERRGAAMGFIMAAFSLASVAGVPGGLFLAKQYGWHAPFIFVGCLGIAVALLVIAKIPSITSHINKEAARLNPFQTLANTFADPNMRSGILFSCFLMFGHFAIIPFIAPYMEMNVGFNKDQVTLIYFVGGVVSIFSSPLVGKMADKFGKLKTFTLFALLATIPIFLITNMPAIPYYYVLVVSAFFFITAGGRIIPAQAMITSVVHPQQRGGFMSLNSSVQQIAVGSASLIAGLIIYKDDAGHLHNYPIVGYLSIAFSLVCIYMARKLKPIDSTAATPPVKQA